MRRRDNRGFTLVELLVVVALIALLSSFIMAALTTARARGRDAGRLAQITAIQQALQLYVTDHSSFPTTGTNPTCLADSGTCWSGLADTDPDIATALASYIPSLPADPLNTRGVGDRYLLYTGTLPHGCTSDPSAMVTGTFILWDPDTVPPDANDAWCRGKGFVSCCYALSCSASYHCAYQVDE
jgi:prepilin-type N-terminal cleavage/methylation domain-containing protein